MRRYLTALPVVCLLVLCLLVTASWAQNPGPKVITSDSVAYGRTYSEWSAAWNQWALSIPVPNHPLFDHGDCSVGQSGPVWFLGGKFCANNDNTCGYSNVQRACSVPRGKALFFPVIDSEDSAVEENDPNKPINDMRVFTESMVNLAANLSVEIDGAAIPHLQDRFRVQSVVFGFSLPPNDLFSAVYGRPFPQGPQYPAVDDGVYVMLSPLPPGPHVLHFHGSVPAWNFTLDVTYLLNVN